MKDGGISVSLQSLFQEILQIQYNVRLKGINDVKAVLIRTLLEILNYWRLCSFMTETITCSFIINYCNH